MELNEEGRKELRKATEQLLNSVPEKKRVQLPRKTLEMLLFEKIKIDNQEIKFPVWSGNFLRKLDLSQVKFNNVSWGRTYFSDEINDKYFMNGFDNMVIDYSYTNANIDFVNGYRVGNDIKIEFCNFLGLDLSNNNFCDMRLFINESILRDTRINLKKSKSLSCIGSDFTNVDLSWYTIKITDLWEKFYLSTFTNTGLNIILNLGELDDFNNEVDNFKSRFFSYLKKGIFDGCYINDKFIISEEDVTTIRNDEKYKKIFNEIFESIEKTIEE